MDTKRYIESGILELYCMGALQPDEEGEVLQMISVYPDIKEAFDNVQKAIEANAAKLAVLPPAHLQLDMDAIFANLEKESKMDPKDLPLINRFSTTHPWLKFLQGHIPAELKSGRYSKVLTHTATVTQMLLVSATDFEDEIHTDILESFLILEGKAECTVGNTITYMEAGSFMQIPLHAHHDVKLCTPQVTAILQRIAL